MEDRKGTTDFWTDPLHISNAIEELESLYGHARYIPRFDPMDELVCCILSQSSSDSSSFPAFTRLKERFPTWEDVLQAQPDELAHIIRKAGLANQKARAISGTLRLILEERGDFDLSFLRDMPLLEARKWLQRLPGVGPKTASIVLCFSFGLAAIPVDTHVYRVSVRLGIIDEKTNENKAHDTLLDLVPDSHAFRYHTTFIQHGRHLCRAPKPSCPPCPLKDRCRYYRDASLAERS